MKKKLYITDEHADRLISHEIVYPNIVERESFYKNNKNYFRFGKNEIAAPELKGIKGTIKVKVNQMLVKPIFSKKYYRKNKEVMPTYNKERAIVVSAYDEDLLGNFNAAFVALSGMNSYATFFLDKDHSVYKCPRFTLELLDGALEII